MKLVLISDSILASDNDSLKEIVKNITKSLTKKLKCTSKNRREKSSLEKSFDMALMKMGKKKSREKDELDLTGATVKTNYKNNSCIITISKSIDYYEGNSSIDDIAYALKSLDLTVNKVKVVNGDKTNKFINSFNKLHSEKIKYEDKKQLSKHNRVENLYYTTELLFNNEDFHGKVSICEVTGIRYILDTSPYEYDPDEYKEGNFVWVRDELPNSLSVYIMVELNKY